MRNRLHRDRSLEGAGQQEVTAVGGNIRTIGSGQVQRYSRWNAELKQNHQKLPATIPSETVARHIAPNLPAKLQQQRPKIAVIDAPGLILVGVIKKQLEYVRRYLER